MSSVMSWLKVHWEDVLVGLGAVYLIALTITNRYVREGKEPPTWVKAMLDVLSLAPLPFVPGRKQKSIPHPGQKDSVPPSLLLLIVGALSLTACAGVTPMDGAHALRTVASDSFTITMNGFKAYDKGHQLDLAQAGDAEGLKRYREEVQVPFRKAVKSTQNALAALSAGIDAAKAGIEQDFGKLSADVMRGLAEITELITRHAIPIPKPSIEASKGPQS